MKPDAQDLLRLADELMAATGPDRRLDIAIGVAVAGFYLAEPRYPGAKQMYGYIDGEGSRVEPGNGSPDRLIPAYTASLDAAMTLVPERHFVALVNSTIDHPEKVDRATAMVAFEGQHKAANPVEAATMPLALCAAALKARAHSTKETSIG